MQFVKIEKRGEMIDINKSELPLNIHEGDVLSVINNTFKIDEEEKRKIQERISNKIANLFEEE